MIFSVIFFALYIVALVIIGIVASRQETEEGFMLADRQVQGTQVAATMSAGFFDGAILSIYIAYVYLYGFSAIWFFIGLALGFLILKKYASRIKQKADEMRVYSMPEYFYRVFGKRSGFMFSVMLILQFFLLLIVNFVISAKVLSTIFPIPYGLAIALGGLVILSYLLLAGFKAVIKTDYFQLILMFLMSAVVAVVLLGKTTIPLSALDLGSAGVVNIVSFFVLGVLGIMVAPDIWQRIFATKDEKNLQRGLTYSAIILPVLALIICVVGIATKQFFPNILPQDALVIGFSELLPPVLQAFGMVLLYAVTLSSADTITFVVSSIISRDLKNYTKRYSEESTRKLTRFCMVLFVIVAALIGVWYQNIIALGLSLASLYVALFPVVFGSLYWSLKESAVFWSLLLSLLSVLVLFVGNYLNPQTALISLPVALVSLMVLQFILKKESRVGVASM